jgi:2-methylcitrate dehydratase PrpD
MSGQSPDAWVAAARFADHALAVEAASLRPAAVAAVKAFTMDTIGVGVGGAASLYAAAVARVAESWGPPRAGNGAHVWARGLALPAEHAAFVNAFQAHCQEFDCVHEQAVVHAFTVVVPVLLAEAEARNLPGPDYVAACVAGVDIAAGLGVAATSQIRFFRPANAGVFGAVAALARARRLSRERTIDALGYALAFASNTMQAHVEGTPALPISMAAAARAAFNAVDLATEGLPGPRGSIDGPFGYLTLFEASSDLAPVLAALGKGWRVSEVSWKPYPSGRASHGGIDMILALRREGLIAETLEELVIEAPPLIHHLVGRPIQPAPLEVNYARLCLPYVGAVALRRGGVGLADFSDAMLNDPSTHDLARRIKVVRVEHPNPAAFTPQRATAKLKDGRTMTTSIGTLPGSVARPLSRAEQLAKLTACCVFALGERGEALAGRLAEACDALDSVDNVGAIAQIASGKE